MPRQISVRELKALLDAGAPPVELVDVRQPWEHEVCALPSSRLVPLDQLAARVDEARPSVEGALVVVYCHHGVRSLHAAALLERVGVPAVSLAGGIDAWSRLVDPSVPTY